jgi:hypothetical protein
MKSVRSLPLAFLSIAVSLAWLPVAVRGETPESIPIPNASCEDGTSGWELVNFRKGEAGGRSRVKSQHLTFEAALQCVRRQVSTFDIRRHSDPFCQTSNPDPASPASCLRVQVEKTEFAPWDRSAFGAKPSSGMERRRRLLRH